LSTAPIAVTPIDAADGDAREHLGGIRPTLDEGFVNVLRSTGADVAIDAAARAEAGRDWWPVAIGWAVRGEVPAMAAAVVRPHSTEEVAAVLSVCNAARVPVTPAAGEAACAEGPSPSTVASPSTSPA